MAGALEAQENIREGFMLVAGGGNPLTPDKLLNAPASQWESIIRGSEPPANMQTFEHNLRHQANRQVDLATFNINHQITRMRNGFEPVDPSAGNPFTRQLYETAIEEARNNPDFGRDDLNRMGQALKQNFQQNIDGAMQMLRSPAPEQPQVTPERAPTLQGPAPGVTSA